MPPPPARPPRAGAAAAWRSIDPVVFGGRCRDGRHGRSPTATGRFPPRRATATADASTPSVAPAALYEHAVAVAASVTGAVVRGWTGLGRGAARRAVTAQHKTFRQERRRWQHQRSSAARGMDAAGERQQQPVAAARRDAGRRHGSGTTAGGRATADLVWALRPAPPTLWRPRRQTSSGWRHHWPRFDARSWCVEAAGGAVQKRARPGCEGSAMAGAAHHGGRASSGTEGGPHGRPAPAGQQPRLLDLRGSTWNGSARLDGDHLTAPSRAGSPQRRRRPPRAGRRPPAQRPHLCADACAFWRGAAARSVWRRAAAAPPARRRRTAGVVAKLDCCLDFL